LLCRRANPFTRERIGAGAAMPPNSCSHDFKRLVRRLPLKAARERLGYSMIATMIDIYGHLADTKQTAPRHGLTPPISAL
jgi:hypothetical protein